MPQRCTRITDVELASRLSYFLWSSMPDDELLGLAEAGKLHEPGSAGRAGEAHAGRSAVLRACRQLCRAVAGDPQPGCRSSPIREKFPAWSPELRDAMKTETRLFFDYDAAREPSALGFPGRQATRS